MAKFKIKTGDLVQVITGKNKGEQGKVLRVITETSRVVVE
ncbi:KOW motif-containing protein, partial [Mycobacterium tuberculosis]|nr:KOW motif-containing protein [Mycobacterium tuberculosis]